MKQQMLKPVPSVMFLLWVLGALNGCMHKTGGTRPGPPEKPPVYVIVHGPWVLVVKEHRVIALVPRDPGHEIVSPYPERHEAKLMPADCKTTTEFELQGVDSADTTTIDPAFRPVTFNIPDWEQKKDEDLFVKMKLPIPTRIDGLSPLQPVEFEGNPGKTEYVPLSEILEFRTRDISKVRLVRTEVSTCKTEKSSYPVKPLSCDEMKQRYDGYWKDPDNPRQKLSPQRPFLTDIFRRCPNGSRFLFVGVGLHPNAFQQFPEEERLGHFAQSGLDFFNNKLLPLVFGGKAKVPRENRLSAIKADPYETGYSWRLPKLLPAVYKAPVAKPVSVMYPYASTENCKSLSVIITTRH